VIFLDADDMLLPGTAARVVERFRQAPGTVKVQYRLRVIDAHGSPTGACIPPANVALADGDVTAEALRAPHDLAYPPTSGNALTTEALARLFPIPDDQRDFADMYILNLIALLGPIATLNGVGGSYRIHGRNAFHSQTFDLSRVRSTIRRNAAAETHLARLGSSLGLVSDPSTFRPTSTTDLAQRLMSLRLDPKGHPLDGDARLALAARGASATIRRRHVPATYRLLYIAWFGAMALVPRRVAAGLATGLYRSWRSGSAVPSPSP